MNLREAYHQVLIDAMNGRNGFKLTSKESVAEITIEADEPGERIPLSDAGFRSKRWLSYVDDYLFGGPPFRDWLKDGGAKAFTFGGTNDHTHGPCIERVQVQDGRIFVESRACELAPIRLVDLCLMWRMMSALKLPLSWHIRTAKLVVWQAVAYKHIPSLDEESPFAAMTRDYLEATQGKELKFMRQRRLLVARDFSGSADEDEVVQEFCRINPNDLQVIFGVPRVRIQGFLKKRFGFSATGPESVSYSWSSLTSETLQAVAHRFKLDLSSLDLDEVIAQRIERTKP